MTNIRFGTGNSDILISTAGDTYLGEEGDDTYIVSPAAVQSGAQISIVDSAGNNTLRLVSDLEITASQVANDALQLTLGNGTVIFIDGAANFTFEVGGETFAPTTTQTFEQFAATLGTTVPADGEIPNAGASTGPVQDDGTLGGEGSGTRDLDALGGSQSTPAGTDVSGSAVEMLDDVNQDNFVDVSGFGMDDSIRFSGTVGDETVDADDVTIDPGEDTILTVNNGGVVSQITLLDVPTGLGVQTVADFNALDTGDILFG